MEQEIKSAGEFLRNVFLTKWKKKLHANEHIYETETDYRYREQICSCQTGKWVGEERIGSLRFSSVQSLSCVQLFATT